VGNSLFYNRIFFAAFFSLQIFYWTLVRVVLSPTTKKHHTPAAIGERNPRAPVPAAPVEIALLLLFFSRVPDGPPDRFTTPEPQPGTAAALPLGALSIINCQADFIFIQTLLYYPGIS